MSYRREQRQDRMLELHLSDAEHRALISVQVPGLEDLIQNGEPTEEGVMIRGTYNQFDFIAGFVAGDANHETRRRKRAELLHSVADQLESLLGKY